MPSSSKNRSLAKTLRGLGELALTGASGAVAEPVAGWGGILAQTSGKDDAGRVVEALRNKLTIAPGEAGQELAGEIGEAIPNWAKQIGQSYSDLGEAAGAENPVLGAAVDTLPAAIGALVPYAGRVKALGAMVPEGKLNRQAGILRGLSRNTEMESPGVKALREGGDPEQVWREFGVAEMPGVPGKYVDEIDDSAAAITGNMLDTSRLTDVLSHPELFRKAQPMKFATVEPVQKYEGSWNPKMLAMGLNPNRSPDDVLSTAIHESQHGVAGLTGLPQGTSPGPLYDAAKQEIDAIRRMRQEVFDRSGMDQTMANEIYADPNSPFKGLINTESEDWKDLVNLNERMADQYDITNREYNRYEQSMGEALARMAEGRRTMSAAERRESYPFSEENFKKFTRTELIDALRSLQQ